jgi:hypothetical protein
MRKSAPDDETPGVSIGNHDGLAVVLATRMDSLLALKKPRFGSISLAKTMDALWGATFAGTRTLVAP